MNWMLWVAVVCWPVFVAVLYRATWHHRRGSTLFELFVWPLAAGTLFAIGWPAGVFLIARIAWLYRRPTR